MDIAHMDGGGLLMSLGVTAAYAALGILVFMVAFKIMEKLQPFSLRKEIEEDHNVALGIIMAAVILGLAIIIAAAVG